MKSSHPNYIGLALYRLSGLAFVACAFSLVAVALMGVALSQQQPTLVAVDEQGRLHGYIEYLNPDMRTDEEIRLAVAQFIKSYLSVNSNTIVEDLRLALSMMSVEMAEREKQILIETNKIAAIVKSRLSAQVNIDELRIEQRHSDAIAVAVFGHIQVNQAKRSFATLVQARIIARTIHNTLGVRIDQIDDL